MEADAGNVFVTNMHGPGSNNDHHGTAADDGQLIEEDVRAVFRQFLTHFVVGNSYIYTDMLRENLLGELYFLEVSVSHIQQFSEFIFQELQTHPARTLPRMELAVVDVADERLLLPSFARKDIQIQLFWAVEPLSIRRLAQAAVSRLVCVSGIVVKSSASHARCVRASIQCTSCRSKMFVQGGRSVDLPQQCQENRGREGQRCRPNPYVVLPMECEYEDQQILKLQELPEDVPTGELPRHLTVIVDRYLVDRASPGARIQVVGVVSVHERRSGGDTGKQQSRSLRSTAGLRAQYLRCTGLMNLSQKLDSVAVSSIHRNFSSRIRSRTTCSWQSEDEAAFKLFAKDHSGDVYLRLAKTIDPAIFGLVDQKKAVVCLLFGGTRKRQDSNAYLRGDLNVLFIGDPSTAKSQLLKYTEKVAPIAIYTSGKGSSAAGLTASVVSNGGGDFYLEAGSLVLADGGVVCIDEFDKMRDQDQVAIHEAMEQQTISIAKANLTTMLNSRTSVLAAANPSLGSYDPMQSNEDQMDFQSSILSRFDLIFKVLDPRNPELDHRLAQHVVSLHKGNSGSTAAAAAQRNAAVADPMASIQPVERTFLTKYIAYAKATCYPKISPEASTVLLDFFVQVRRDAYQHTLEALKSTSSNAKTPIIQITARQLESLVRITESLAKMRLDPIATVRDAQEAIRLFQAATVDAINSGVAENSLSELQSEHVLKIEEAIRRRLAIGSVVEYQRLVNELQRMAFDAKLIASALWIMVRRDELEWRKQRTMICRLK